MRTLFAVCFVLLLAPSIARADAVGPPPTSCPPGASPSSSHAGPLCVPTADCSADSDCSEGTCMPVMQCVETRDCGGLREPDAAPCTVEHVVGPCSGDGTCATGECRARRVCSSGSTSTSGGCGCRLAGGAAGATSSWPAAFALLAIALTRRRR